MNFSIEEVIATGIISFLTALLLQKLEPKARLAYWFPHEFTFNVKKENVILKTNSLTVQNLGRKAAENIEILHMAEPDFFEIFPSVNYEVQTSPNNNHIIRIPFLGAKEFITLQILSYKTVPQILSVRSKDCIASQIPITVQRIYPKWVNLLASFLMIFGIVTLISLLVMYINRVQLPNLISQPISTASEAK